MFEAIQQIDFQILDWIQQNMRTPWLDWLMPKITFLGEAGLFWILLAILVLLWKPRRRCGMKMLAGLAGGFLLWSVGLKKLIARPRPCWINEGMEMLIRIPRDFSFPSGHSCGIHCSRHHFPPQPALGDSGPDPGCPDRFFKTVFVCPLPDGCPRRNTHRNPDRNRCGCTDRSFHYK